MGCNSSKNVQIKKQKKTHHRNKEPEIPNEQPCYLNDGLRENCKYLRRFFFLFFNVFTLVTGKDEDEIMEGSLEAVNQWSSIEDDEEYNGDHLIDLSAEKYKFSLKQPPLIWQKDALIGLNTIWYNQAENDILIEKRRKDVIFPTSVTKDYFMENDVICNIDLLAMMSAFHVISTGFLKDHLEKYIIPIKSNLLKCRFIYTLITHTNFELIQDLEETDKSKLQYYLYNIKHGLLSKSHFFAKLCR